MNDMYVRLTYDQYKALEKQMRNFDSIESVHKTVEGGYHKAIRLKVTEDFLFEFQGPLVKAPLER